MMSMGVIHVEKGGKHGKVGGNNAHNTYDYL